MKKDKFEKQFGKVDFHDRIQHIVNAGKQYCTVCGNEIFHTQIVCQDCIDSGVADRFYEELEER